VLKHLIQIVIKIYFVIGGGTWPLWPPGVDGPVLFKLNIDIFLIAFTLTVVHKNLLSNKTIDSQEQFSKPLFAFFFNKNKFMRIMYT